MEPDVKNPLPATGTETGLVLWMVEDTESFRKNIAVLLNLTEGLRCARTFIRCEDAIEALDEDLPDVILMDISLPGMDGIEGMKHIKVIAPSVQVIMLTVFDDHDKIFRAICAGASGYLLKSTPVDKIIDSLKEILDGGAPMSAQIARKVLTMFPQRHDGYPDHALTPREQGILKLLVEGYIKKEIASQLGLSYHTIDKHMRNIYTKLNVHTRTGAVAKALKERLL